MALLVWEDALTVISWPQVKLFMKSEKGEQPPMVAIILISCILMSHFLAFAFPMSCC